MRDRTLGAMTWGTIIAVSLALLVKLGLIAGLVWAAIHFIRKFW